MTGGCIHPQVTGISCDDGLWCTEDTCGQGGCFGELLPGFCLVAGECYQEGATNPGDPCGECDPAKETGAWSVAPDGAPCGNWDVCFIGECCTPFCWGMECGDDGCGGACGICAGAQESCLGGSCVCLPDCLGKECGEDGCAGSCGECDDGNICTLDSCDSGNCAHEVVCCELDEECYDGDLCTIDSCSSGQCAYVPTGAEGCCIPDVFAEDFESGQGAWDFESNSADYTWHISSANFFSGGKSLFFGNAGGSAYGNNNLGSATTPWFELPEGAEATLSFQLWRDTESCCDKLGVYVVDEAGGHLLQEFSGSDTAWTKKELTLQGYSGKAIRIRFEFESDYSVTSFGVFVDELKVDSGC